MRECTQKILAVDFDGTITADGHGANMVLRNGCEEALKELHSLGFELILWTCRSGAWLKQATDFLKAEGLLNLFSKVNENSDRIYGPDTRKVIADLYIDDRVLGGFTSWTDVVNKVKSRFLPPMVSRKKIISDMVMTTRHDAGLRLTEEEKKAHPLMSGMTQRQYDALWNSMAQLFDKDVKPVMQNLGISIGD